MSKADFTVDSYNEKANEISAKFQSLGARVEDIDRALLLADAASNASVVELGSGDGRDAAEIIKRVGRYVGVEPSEGLISIAKRNVPHATFVKTTAQEHGFIEEVDVVFAFASLLHVNKDDLKNVFDKIYDALRAGGILYVSLKESEEYTPLVTNDEWGKRQFYLYSTKNVIEIAGNRFEPVYEDHQARGDTEWLTLALKKIS